MPEGDTVYRAAKRLDAALRDGVVDRFELRVPALVTADLRGETVREVVPRGKHLLMRIGAMTLRSHLRMDGSWHVYRPGERWRAPAFKARAIVGTDRAGAVGFDVSMLALVPTRDEETLVGHLGPDPLADRWDAAEATRRVSLDPRPVHVAMLDQRNVAGFGNEYAAELLFLRGILPTTPATDVDAEALIALGTRTIRANVALVDRTFTGVNRRGRTTWVYGRAGRPCRRCGTLIETGALGAGPAEERTTFWCPRCQR
ncbi:Fpg/Nei family DNA glycosylase [Microbacterium pseudoresistens]|uniref:DNA-(apurinic or apyrimidinic site) lyase n=1 Tax=Microbacterium pseudoresistens TaxID=640634 RepID=A0A7Y9ETT6_9MICO|nr:Fpg/Nei family DNA glycosylase [Microbacterium pseudoresistens]NYD53656.1 endonuclease-8 [Microbacterium pseudoresistens]